MHKSKTGTTTSEPYAQWVCTLGHTDPATLGKKQNFRNFMKLVSTLENMDPAKSQIAGMAWATSNISKV